jgi:dolichol-phosphate mannosyltransferase
VPIQVQTLAEWEAQGIPGLLSVLIPAQNEEGRIERTVRELIEVLTAHGISHEILVVNDNSTDSTKAILERLTGELPTFRYIDNEPPAGFGFGIRTGLSQFRGDAVAIVMADASDPPQDVVRFYRKFQEGFDCVFGSRFVRGGSATDYPPVKRLLNRAGNLMIRTLFMLKYNDVTNAFKLYGRNVIAGVQPILACHFNITVELPLKAIVRGYSYTVIPNGWLNRAEGISKFHVREMGSRYLFIILYCLFEKLLVQADYKSQEQMRRRQLQVWSR